MKKSLSVAAATLLLALATTPAFASHGGQWGLGTLYSDFPLGVFFGLNDKTTVTFGLNFRQEDTQPAPFDQESGRFGIVGALEYDFWSGDRWGFGAFPAVGFTSISQEDVVVGGTNQSVDSATDIQIALALGGHFDIVDAVSIYVTHGLVIDSYSPPVGDSTTTFGTFGNQVGELGVNFWFP